MPQQTLSQVASSLLSEANKYELIQIGEKRLVTIKEANTLFDTPRLEKHLAENCVFNSWLEMQAILTAQRAGVLADLYMYHGNAKPEQLKAALVKRLYDDYGLRRDIARWAVEQWAAALGSFLDDTNEITDLPPLKVASRKLSYHTELVSDQDPYSIFTRKNKPVRMPPVNLGHKPVTNALWRSVFPNHIVSFGLGTLPVYSLDRKDILHFCNLLSIRDSLMPCYNFTHPKEKLDATANGWRLPSKAESRFLSEVWDMGRKYLYLARNV